MPTLRRVAPILLLLLPAAVACSGSGAGKTPRTRPAPLVAVAPVERRDVTVTVRAPVDLRPLFQADVGSKTLGYLDTVLVDRGDRVKKGQLIATVRPSDLPDQLAAERGALAQIQANVALAKSNAERARSLAPRGLVSQQELQSATAALAAAEAQESGSKARIGALAVKLGEMRIEAPLDGIISARRLDPGALVGPGAAGPIVSVVQTRTLRVFIAVNEHDIGRVKLGQEAAVEVDAFPGRLFKGRVVRMSPAFEPTTRTIDAEVQLDNQTGELMPGMYGRGQIVLEVHPAASVVPVTAVIINENGRYAFVVDGTIARRRTVETGVDGGDWLEITRGLVPGEQVVVAGTDGLADGSTVRLAGGNGSPKQEASATVRPPGPEAVVAPTAPDKTTGAAR